jgi:hypothetical protein
LTNAMASARGRARVPFLFVLLLLGTLLFAATFASARDEEREQERHEGSRRPYVFDRRSFRRTAARSEHGSIRALPPFYESSELLHGVRDYRVAVLEANPRSFVVPAHTDADTIGYVVQGPF